MYIVCKHCKGSKQYYIFGPSNIEKDFKCIYEYELYMFSDDIKSFTRYKNGIWEHTHKEINRRFKSIKVYNTFNELIRIYPEIMLL